MLISKDQSKFAYSADQTSVIRETSVLHETELLKKLSPHLMKLFDFHPTHVSQGGAKWFQLFAVASARNQKLLKLLILGVI